MLGCVISRTDRGAERSSREKESNHNELATHCQREDYQRNFGHKGLS